MRKLAGLMLMTTLLTPRPGFGAVAYIEVGGSPAALPSGVLFVVHTPPAAADCGGYTQIFNSFPGIGLGAGQTPATVASAIAGHLSANAPGGYTFTSVGNVIRIISPDAANAQWRIIPTEELPGCITGYDVPPCVNNVGSSTSATNGRSAQVEGFTFCSVDPISFILNTGSGCPGDLSCDGHVDQNDVDMLADLLGHPCPGSGPCIGDLDGNGLLDANDVAVLGRNVGRCCADLNNSGFADAFDISLLGQAIGPCPSGQPCPADINCDGVVNQADVDWFAANVPCQWTQPVQPPVRATSPWSILGIASLMLAAGTIALRRRRRAAR